ncbi:FecR family protein [Flavobacteriaceae bacterium]|nr:FecR family protein [Flavobacteriaceae bacterium]
MEAKQALKKWLDNQATPSDMEVLELWPDFDIYKKIDAHTKEILLPEHDITSGIKALNENPLFNKPRQITPAVITMSRLLKIAAVFILLAISGVYLTTLPTNIQAPITSIQTIELPDSSKITLNENSRVTYKKYGWPFKREVTLDGEAYFEVAKGKTFTVLTPKGTISVLGTSFNVKIENDILIVSCFEGLVSVKANGIDTLVSAGDSFSFSPSLENQKLYTSKPTWIFNESSFVDLPLEVVLLEIEKHYKVTVTTKNIDVTLRYTCSFTHTNLEQALETVTLPLNLYFSKVSENEVQIYNPKKQ